MVAQLCLGVDENTRDRWMVGRPVTRLRGVLCSLENMLPSTPVFLEQSVAESSCNVEMLLACKTKENNLRHRAEGRVCVQRTSHWCRVSCTSDERFSCALRLKPRCVAPRADRNSASAQIARCRIRVLGTDLQVRTAGRGVHFSITGAGRIGQVIQLLRVQRSDEGGPCASLAESQGTGPLQMASHSRLQVPWPVRLIKHDSIPTQSVTMAIVLEAH